MKIAIVNEAGTAIPGAVYLYDASGTYMSKIDVPAAGIEITADAVAGAATFQIDSPGYVGYAVLALQEDNKFTLVKNEAGKQFGIGLLLLIFVSKAVGLF